MKKDCGVDDAEVKLNQVSESRFIYFLQRLSRLGGLAFASCVDVSFHSPGSVAAHQAAQADKILEHQDKMIYAEGRAALTTLSEAIGSLPLQLYTQLQCQVELIHHVLCHATIYYSQWNPETLGRLGWRVDQKDTIPTAYENAFRMILPAFLQARTIREPMISLVEGNYEFFNRFQVAPGKHPTYLKDEYGFDVGEDVLDVGQMVRDDFELVDSKDSPGVQVADLLASGLRKLLRGRIERAGEVTHWLGANMVQVQRDRPIVRLLSLGESRPASSRSAQMLSALARSAKPLLRM